ncbi:MAG: hypothetical protein U0269_31780 [Polyangiales bacterium]
MPRAHAAAIVLLALGLSALSSSCQRTGAALRASEDAALAGPRTLGFIELRAPVPTPSSVSGGFVPSAMDEGDSGAASGVAAALETEADASALPDAGSPAPGPDASARGDRGAAWVVQPLAGAHARAIDHRGHRMALIDERVVDESAPNAPAQPLVFDDSHCEFPFDTLSFDEDGAGYLVRRGRVFVRAPGATEWSRTTVCNDVEGEPWLFSATRGWGVLSRRARSATPAMLYTREIEGRSGWFAVSAADAELSAAALDDDGSRVVLVHGGHPLMIDMTNEVAGAIFATANLEFEGITRTRSGVVVWRQDGEDLDLLVSRLARGSYRRERIARDAETATVRVLGVWTGALGQRVAVTTRGVEFYEAGRAHSAEVARWAAPLNTAHGINIGWLSDGRLAVATPNAIARQP